VRYCKVMIIEGFRRNPCSDRVSSGASYPQSRGFESLRRHQSFLNK
jgi:hypothetical protein